MSIPATIQASAAVAKSARYEGELTLKLLPRLAAQVEPSDVPLQVHLAAGRESGYARLHGDIRGCLRLMCQRCEKPFDWTLFTAVDVRLVSNEAEEQSALQDSDPYCVQDDQLSLRELVEDEVLLALPMLARCESCENSVMTAPVSKPPPAPKRENPFAALKSKLKH